MPTRPRERVCFEARRHGAVLARPLAQAVALAVGGALLVIQPWPAPVGGALLLAAAALLAVRAAWVWERTRIVVTTEQLLVVRGTLRRRSATLPLARAGRVEVEQSVLGRLLGYGTLVAGDLELTYVPEPRRVSALVAQV